LKLLELPAEFALGADAFLNFSLDESDLGCEVLIAGAVFGRFAADRVLILGH